MGEVNESVTSGPSHQFAKLDQKSIRQTYWNCAVILKILVPCFCLVEGLSGQREACRMLHGSHVRPALMPPSYDLSSKLVVSTSSVLQKEQ